MGDSLLRQLLVDSQPLGRKLHPGAGRNTSTSGELRVPQAIPHILSFILNPAQLQVFFLIQPSLRAQGKASSEVFQLLW